MSKEILTRCGYRCDLCLAYKDNIAKEDKRQLLSDGWYKYYGFRIEPSDIYCEGCISSNCLTADLIDDECPVRPCVIEKGYENCSQCDDFVCEKFQERVVCLEDIQNQFDEKIKRNDYRYFIKPYENLKRLNELVEKQGKYSRMYNGNIVPDEDDMVKFIGEESYIKLWQSFVSYIEDKYSLDKYIKFGGKNYGWALQYKQGKRTIVSIYPERKAFTILFTFGGKELEKLENKKDEIIKSTYELIKNTKQYHDGKWVWLRVASKSELDDSLLLLNIKKKPKKGDKQIQMNA